MSDQFADDVALDAMAANERMGAILAYIKRFHPTIYSEALVYLAEQFDGTPHSGR